MEIINDGKEQQNFIPKNTDKKNPPYGKGFRTGQGRAAGGLILILVGFILLLANLDIIEGRVGYYLFDWRTILIALGIIFMGARENKISGYILTGLGIVFWLPELLGHYHVRFGDVFWPSILIIIGVVLITRHKRLHLPGVSDSESADGYLRDTSVFSGGAKIIKSKNFKGGTITAIFGGSEFDMRQVELNPDGAVVDVVTIFGGTKFIVPPDWNVVSDAVAILGGISDKRPQKMNPDPKDTGKTLIIKGVAIFGGVEIKSF